MGDPLSLPLQQDLPTTISGSATLSQLLAYFDPSAGSLLLQALLGGFGGIVVIGRYLWMQLFGNQTYPEILAQSQAVSIPAQNRSR